MEDLFDFESLPDATGQESTGNDFDFESLSDKPSEYEVMPTDWNKGQYSDTNPKHDRIVANRMWEAQQSQEAQDAGEIGAVQGAYQKIGKGIVGSGVDVVIDEVKEAVIDPVIQLGKVISDTFNIGEKAFKIDEATGNFVSDAGNDLGASIYENTESLRKGAEELGTWWSTLDKNTRKNIEVTGLISIIIPNPVSTVTKSVTKPISYISRKLSSSSRKGIAAQDARLLEEFVRPPIAGKYAARSESATTDGIRRISSGELKQAKTVSELKGYKPTASDRVNLSVVNKHTKAKVEAYGEALKTGKPINATSVQSTLDNGMKSFTVDNAVFVNKATGLVDDTVARVVTGKVRKLIRTEAIAEGRVITPAVLHRSRLALDKIIKKGGDDFKINTTNPIGASYQEARTLLNKMVDESVPAYNTSKLRTSISDLITTSENVGARIVKNQALTPIEQAYHVLGRYGRMGWAAGSLGKLVGAGGRNFTVAEGMSRGVVNAALALGVVYAGGKIVLSRGTQRALIATLGKLDSVAKTVTKAADKIEIKSARAGLVKLLAGATVADSVKEKEEQ